MREVNAPRMKGMTSPQSTTNLNEGLSQWQGLKTLPGIGGTCRIKSTMRGEEGAHPPLIHLETPKYDPPGIHDLKRRFIPSLPPLSYRGGPLEK